ncbi:MAG TPA: YiiX/YebB-like N1pC/P60 family cysteine hydrolase [Verrucomicrobiae bacterium]|nr:YiiX/YebB-like N1pC/P60 family cysteine hydrolase [Verrucomicrobiae bacterium]
MRGTYSPELERVLKRLKVGDIILVHTRRPLSEWIRRATKSYWSHVALVFDIPTDGGLGHDHIIIEADDGQGVQIHRLSTYLNESGKYVLGIKRMKHMTDEERERFRGFFLDVVDTPYDTARLGAFFLLVAVNKLLKRDLTGYFARRKVNPDRFICTTFAQRAYYLAVAPERRREVLFRGHEAETGLLEQMEVIAPRDVATSPATEWLYNPHV